MIAGVEDQVVAARPEDPEAVGSDEPVGIDVLTANGDDDAAAVASIHRGRLRPERRLAEGTPGHRRLHLGLDHLGHEREHVGVQAVERPPMERLSAQQDRLTQPEVVHEAESDPLSSAQSRFAELPPDTTSIVMPNRSAIPAASRE